MTRRRRGASGPPHDAARRRWLGLGCAQCLALACGPALAADAWTRPPRFDRPDTASDEGGLWALLDREERKLRRGAFLMRDGGLRDYLTGIACKLGGEHCADTRVYTVRTPLFNASMAANGMMQVWSGLLLRVENEAQLAAVIGHELGHYLQRHQVARLRDVRDRSALASFVSLFGVAGLIGNLALIAGMYGYSRDHEHEADRIGAALMAGAGYDAREAAAVWRNLRLELAANPAADPARNSVLFATHPSSEERERALAEAAGSAGGFVGEAEYQARLDPLLWELCDDELKRAQYDETIVLFTRLADRRPRRADLRYFRGEARRLRGQGDDPAHAMEDFQAALALDQPPPVAHRALGFVHHQQGHADKARAAFGRYLEAAPDAPDAGIIKTYL
jgi:predicted Zn-dependent protease